MTQAATSTTARFLHALFDGKSDESRILIWLLDGKRSQWFKDIDEAANYASSRPGCCYFGVGLSPEDFGEFNRCEAEKVAAIPGLWADIDFMDPVHKKSNLPPTTDDVLALLADFPLAPSIIVHTGHGIQSYWLFRELWVFENDEERDRAQELARRFHVTLNEKAKAHGWDVDTVSDLARVLRVVGTTNHKAEPVPVRFIKCDEERRYNPSDFEPYLLEVPDPKKVASNGHSAGSVPSATNDVDDTKLIGRILQSEQGPKFRRLFYDADLGEYGNDQSRADLALACILAFWTGNDAGRIDRLFRQSKLMRDKWDDVHYANGETYGQHAIAKAIALRPDEPNNSHEANAIEPVGFACTDIGNGERMATQHGGDLRFCHPENRWYVWDGRRWQRDDTAEVERRAKATVRGIYYEASNEMDKNRRKELAKHARSSESDARLRAMISRSASEPTMPILPAHLDADPWLLNVANGVLDLRQPELHPHLREYYITRLIDCDYDPDAQCPRFLEFLHQAMGGNEQLVAFLRRAAGYSLTGSTRERCLFILHGSGDNGKTTLLRILLRVIGEYGLRTPTQTLLSKRGEGVPNDVAALKGARLVMASESEENSRLAEATIKDLTGGDAISARFMRAEWFSFFPECKIWLSTNHKPVIRGSDKAIWNRIRLVPFNVTIPKNKQDSTLYEKLEMELPGILAWMVAGCGEWQRDGLGIPEEVRVATDAYRAEMDVIAPFLDDWCILNASARTIAPHFYGAYLQWAEENHERALSQRAFGLRLTERGLQRGKANGKNWWIGVGLRSESTVPMGTDNPPLSDTDSTLSTHEYPENRYEQSAKKSSCGKPRFQGTKGTKGTVQYPDESPAIAPPSAGDLVWELNPAGDRLNEPTKIIDVYPSKYGGLWTHLANGRKAPLDQLELVAEEGGTV